MAAAARLARWLRCAANLAAQSGRTRSVVITLGSFADSDCVRRLPPAPDGGGEMNGVGEPEWRELLELMAVFMEAKAEDETV